MINEKALEERLTALEGAKAWSPRVVSRLETLLRSDAEEALFRVNPISFASERSIPETEAIDLFLHGTAVGLFDMDWLLLCPMCSDVVENFRSLAQLHSHYHCPLCHNDFEAALDDYIAVTFIVSPTVRRIRFHDPQSLPVEEYAYYYKASAEGLTPDGVPWVEIIKSLIRALTWLRPGATEILEVDAVEGTLLGFDMESDATFAFTVEGEPATAPQRVAVDFSAGACTPTSGTLAPGKVVFEVRNTTDARTAVFGVLQFPPGVPMRGMLNFKPFLSGKRLLMTQTFRDLFRSEVIKASEGIAIREVTLLFTDLKGSTALYQRIGDLNAYMQVQRHFERLLDVTVRHHGAVTKTIGDAVMAAFSTAADAVRAAIEMRRAVEELNSNRPQRDFILKIGMHTGAAIAVTLNNQLDYFGQTVNIAARVQNLAGGDEICVTEDVYKAPGVAELLAPYAARRIESELKGIEQSTPVYFVGAGADHHV